MTNTNYTWLEEELSSRGYEDDTDRNKKLRKIVIELFYTLDAQDPDTIEIRKTAVDLFHDLQRTESLQMRNIITDGAEWVPFYLGVAPIGTVVRVRKNAYTAESGRPHNGLVGRLIAGRGGRAIIKYIGRNDGIGHYHDPQMLEALDKKSQTE
jgi:hypothetical protein